MSRVYPTAVDDLWDALTNPERIPRWFLPVSGDLREGGHYALEGNAHGDIELCDPPHQLGVTWVFGEEMPPTWVTVTLAVDDHGTRLTLEHLGPVPEELWDQFGPGATGLGWDLAFLGLGLHLASGAGVDPATATEWPTTPEGIDFIRRCGEGWTEAAVADGMPRDRAEAGTRQSVAMYTGGAADPSS